MWTVGLIFAMAPAEAPGIADEANTYDRAFPDGLEVSDGL